MASNAFYGLSKRKIRNFWKNFQELLAVKSTKDITVDDVLEYTSVSRTTFYNYFTNMNELYDDFMEFVLVYVFEDAVEEIGKIESIFSIADAVHKMAIKRLENKMFVKAYKSLTDANNRFVRTIHSPYIEQYLTDMLKMALTETVEGKKINSASKLYTLINIIVYSLQVSLEAIVLKKSGSKSSLSMFDFDFILNMLKQGYEMKYL